MDGKKVINTEKFINFLNTEISLIKKMEEKVKQNKSLGSLNYAELIMYSESRDTLEFILRLCTSDVDEAEFMEEEDAQKTS